MRVVVVGATGNVGTAVLRRLHAAEGVTEVVGIARRQPDASMFPFSGASWHTVDVGARGSVRRLAAVFTGADAVIHLAWALQPNRTEETMSRTNVVGTAHVLAAVAASGVPQVVVASSVGAYSAAPKDRRLDESWPTGGLHTSHYSRHKAANERAFDTFEAANPDVVLTRMRPGLIFQHDAATEVAALFLGNLIPTRWLGRVRPPVLPLPRELVFQALHADDAADAFWRAIERRAGGAFNLAAEPVLTPRVIAEVVGAKHLFPVSLSALRTLVSVAWKLRIIPTDPGWLDIAAHVPVMAMARAEEVLGWQARVSATAALAEMIDGLADRDRVVASDPLHGVRP